MPRASLASGIELEYDTFGRADDPVIVLVMGYTAQMIAWDDAFCERLAADGFHVVRFDNRDCGLSTKLDGVQADPSAVMAAVLAGAEVPDVPYTLSDMAADVVGLLDSLSVGRAHVVGASMGGMIAQTLAIEHPGRLLSVTSIMSTIGDPDYGRPHPDAMTLLLSPPPDDRAAVIERSSEYAVWGSKRYFDAERAASLAARSFDRAHYPQGATRQLAAIWASGDRSDALRRVTTPTLVIHGLDDTLIAPSGGRRTAELVETATLMEVVDMGHDLPEPLWPLLCGAITGHARVAESQGVAAS